MKSNNEYQGLTPRITKEALEDLYTPEEVAAYLKVDIDYLHYLIETNELLFVVINEEDFTIRIPKSSIEDFVENHKAVLRNDIKGGHYREQ